MSPAVVSTTVKFGHDNDPYKDYEMEINVLVDVIDSLIIEFIAGPKKSPMTHKPMPIDRQELNKRLHLVLGHEMQGVGHDDRKRLINKMVEAQEVEYRAAVITNSKKAKP